MRSQVGVSGQHQFRMAPCGPHGGGGKTGFATSRPGEDEFAIVNAQAMEFLRVVETEESILHLMSGSILA